MPVPDPLVTIIVPGRDIAAFAPAAIASLRAQTSPRWRAILVDDGSVDGTGTVFADAVAADPRFCLVTHAEPRGLGAARNAGLARVDTEFVGFLDGDDEFAPTAISRMTTTLQRSGSDFAAGAYVRSRWNGSFYAPGRVQPWVAAATSPERIGTTLTEHPAAAANIVAWSKVSRTDFWGDLRFPEGVTYEDQIVAQQLYTRARAFDVLPDVVVHWRLRADGTSITQGKDQLPVLRDYLTALRGGIDVLQQSGASAALVKRLELIIAMDMPPLWAIAAAHPDERYLAELEQFADELRAVPEYRDARPDPQLASALGW